MRIGACDCCDRQNVPVGRVEVSGIETYACFICQGEDDADPYGVVEGSPAWIEANGQFGVGA